MTHSLWNPNAEPQKLTPELLEECFKRLREACTMCGGYCGRNVWVQDRLCWEVCSHCDGRGKERSA